MQTLPPTAMMVRNEVRDREMRRITRFSLSLRVLQVGALWIIALQLWRH